tara:strand:- start:837 stop:983 length:147 start_codon:yes stop_codon:yes gene_type:complete
VTDIYDHIDWEHVETQGFLDEETFFEGVADMLDCDYSQVADRDPFEFI